MLGWFKALSPGRKLLVGWNVVIFPFWLAGLLYAVFLFGMPFQFGLVLLAGVVVAAIAGFFIVWKLAK